MNTTVPCTVLCDNFLTGLASAARAEITKPRQDSFRQNKRADRCSSWLLAVDCASPSDAEGSIEGSSLRVLRSSTCECSPVVRNHYLYNIHPSVCSPARHRKIPHIAITDAWTPGGSDPPDPSPILPVLRAMRRTAGLNTRFGSALHKIYRFSHEF